MTIFALSGAQIFDGHNFHDGHALVIEGRYITDMVLATRLNPVIQRYDLKGGLLAPGFIDVQVNGGGGVLLNDAPSLESVEKIARAHQRFGTVGMLPTVITDKPAILVAAIEAVRAARRQGESEGEGLGLASILGLHVEGPFLDPLRKGAHALALIRDLNEADIALLAGANCGQILLTLAPNRVAPSMISALVDQGILVSLGHSEASFSQATAALAAGASSFTHLFNAMSQLTGREPGMVGAALTDAGALIGIIADGHHVHPASLKLAVAAVGTDRLMLVTDAMPPAAGGPDYFTLQGRHVLRKAGKLQLEDGTLAGSNLTMDEAVRYSVEVLGVSLKGALQMASRNPARFLKRHKDLGLIASGALASLVHLSDDLTVKATWVEGQKG